MPSPSDPKSSRPTAHDNLHAALVLADASLVSMFVVGLALLTAIILTLIFVVWDHPYFAVVTAIFSLVGFISHILVSHNGGNRVTDTLSKSVRELHYALGVAFAACLVTSLLGGYISTTLRNKHQDYAVRRAQIAEVAKGLIKSEDSIYHRSGYYSLDPRVYVSDHSLRSAITKRGADVTVSDNSERGIVSVVFTIRMPEAYNIDGGRFLFTLLNGTVRTTTCSGSSGLGCHDGRWTIS